MSQTNVVRVKNGQLSPRLFSSEVLKKSEFFKKGGLRIIGNTMRDGRVRVVRVTKNHPILLQFIIVGLVSIIVQLRVLTANGSYVTWGNYLLPFAKTQYEAYTNFPSGWMMYQYMGAPLIIPFVAVVNYLTALGPLLFFDLIGGAVFAAKAYMVLSTLLLSFASILLARVLIQSRVGQVVTALLIVVGPFQLELYGQGDYVYFVSLSLVFLSISLLSTALRRRTLTWIAFPGSLFLLVLSLNSIQIFELGFILYCVFLVYLSLTALPSGVKHPVRATLLDLARVLFLPVFLAPFALSQFTTSYYVGPGSTYALPLNTFASYSMSPVAVFSMLGYVGSDSSLTGSLGYLMLESASSALVADVWLILVVALTAVIWGGLLLYNDRRAPFLLTITVLGAIFGAGTLGPINSLNVYLYLHFIGYQALNASYYWDWVIVVPMTALGLGVLVEDVVVGKNKVKLLSRNAVSKVFERPKNAGAWSKGFCSRRVSESLPVVLVIVLSGVLLVPYAYGSEYGSKAMHVIQYPADYSKIPDLLDKLVGKSYSGVALFNPDMNWFQSDSPWPVQNVFAIFPNVRTPGLPFYGSPPVPSNLYYYWVYEQFYTNSTHDLGALLGMAGVQFFLVFYGTQSASFYPYFLQFSYQKNASLLMEYQIGVEEIVEEKDFAIYRNLNYSGVASPASSLTVVAGGYSELAAMASVGLNIAKLNIIFPEDFTPDTCKYYLGKASNWVASSANAIEGAVAECVATSAVDPVGSLNAMSETSESWLSSNQFLGGSIWGAWPTPLAVASGGSRVMSLNLGTHACMGGCEVWVPVRFSGDGGLLNISWQGGSWEANTAKGWGSLNNSMIWVKFHVASSLAPTALTVTSRSGWNAVGSFYVVNSSLFSSTLKRIQTSGVVSTVSSGYTIGLPNHNLAGQFSGYCGDKSSSLSASSSLCITASSTYPVTLDLPLSVETPGILSLSLLAVADVHVLIANRESQIFGFDTGRYNESNATYSWVRVPISNFDANDTSGIDVRIANGTVYLSKFSFIPYGLYDSVSAPRSNFSLDVASTYRTNSVHSLVLSVSNLVGGGTNITGSITFNQSQWSEGLAFVTFNATPPYGGFALRYVVSPGLLLNLDGILFGGSSPPYPLEVSSDFYYLHLQGGFNKTYISFSSYGAPTGSNISLSFGVNIFPIFYMPLSYQLNGSGAEQWSINPSVSGYSITGVASTLVYIRIPYFSDLNVEPENVQLHSGLGGIISLAWDSQNFTQFTAVVRSSPALLTGYLISFGGGILWIAGELIAARLSTKPMPTSGRTMWLLRLARRIRKHGQGKT